MTPLLQISDLSVRFKVPQGPLRRPLWLQAVDRVDLEVGEGETVGLVGESGSGKSTTGRAILRLVEPTSGSIRFDGVEMLELDRRTLRQRRRDLQMVFQDPYSSLDPSMVIADIVGEPLEVHDGLKGEARDQRVLELLRRVGLGKHHLQRYPYEFSGGQRQRIAIARAIATEPKLVVLDEAVSALDVSTQNQIITLLEQLRNDLGAAFLFIAHDLAVVRHISHRVAVMYLGQIVEHGPVDRIYEKPAHPYTEALLSAVPIPDPPVQRSRERIVLEGDLPDPTAPPAGCSFHTRCQYVMDICRHVEPEATPVDGGGTVRCHLQTTGMALGGASLPESESVHRVPVDIRPSAG